MRLGTGAPLHPTRVGTGLLVQAESLEPLLIDTCGGLELARQLALVRQPLEAIRRGNGTGSSAPHFAACCCIS